MTQIPINPATLPLVVPYTGPNIPTNPNFFDHNGNVLGVFYEGKYIYDGTVTYNFNNSTSP